MMNDNPQPAGELSDEQIDVEIKSFKTKDWYIENPHQDGFEFTVAAPDGSVYRADDIIFRRGDEFGEERVAFEFLDTAAQQRELQAERLVMLIHEQGSRRIAQLLAANRRTV